MDDLEKLKMLAGVTNTTSLGASISMNASDKGRIMREQNIRPGTDAWFKLWFAKPYLTGESPVNNDK